MKERDPGRPAKEIQERKGTPAIQRSRMERAEIDYDPERDDDALADESLASRSDLGAGE